MIYKTYGKTNKQVSAVGFGGMRFDLEKSDEENAKLLLYAWDQGINYFDTAPGYCNDQSETIFGIALKQLHAQGRAPYVATKGWPEKCDTVEKSCQAVEKSLKKLQVDKIDFYHIWCVREMGVYDLAMRPGGQYEGLLKCQEKGLIDHIVVSTHLQGNQANQILQKNEFDGILLGVNILNFPYRWQAVQGAYDMGYGVVAMNPLAGGIIPNNEDKFQFLCRTPDETPTEAALAFCVGCPQITVTLNGFTTREHIDTACKVADSSQPLSEADIDRVRKHLGDNLNEICTGCGYCLADCPKKIPIASYMLVYNNYQMFNHTDQEMAQDIKNNKGYGILVGAPPASDCIACKRCLDNCTQHLNIVERLEKIAHWEELIKQQEQQNQP
ncbi:MAG: aldo/keto reductase [Sedimentisphaerales bacterium]|nr:aldo/keto reductase [Sedimentisphaerales bacterium]